MVFLAMLNPGLTTIEIGFVRKIIFSPASKIFVDSEKKNDLSWKSAIGKLAVHTHRIGLHPKQVP